MSVAEPKVEKILELDQVKKHFTMGRGQVVQAVDNISFHVYRGETLGLVGESGCGKSTVGRTIIRLYEATDGEIKFKGQSTRDLKGEKLKQFNREMQMIFQDPYASLNPRMTVGDIIAEGLDIHKMAKGQERREKVIDLLKTVGLNEEHADRFPHEFSGGQRQRIGIARALAVDPDFIIADEPISALDVSIQAQVVNLMKKLQREKGLTYLFIAHDLSMVKYISDRIGVMYLGNLVELAESQELYDNPLHPYTEALLSAVPIPDPDSKESGERIILKGDVPSPIDPPSGCRFRTRCPKAMDVCAQEAPKWREVRPLHWVSCHLYQEESLKKEEENKAE
ncbi:ABC transporter ATP-binding protein [Paludifilum halophilum]|uniref:Oligopeptide ABC transporter ATP-binding protein OppF n=1 Tax=Paludifilum halophilum TaxID=1642702 RepID=A0A235B4P0_9BACL|nr:oligopeptide/dipeptide ABC transporter ATP-binding protein [Paludifilum halophilum]OYD07201.1 oligopeptide ABC transporter ATP-binding protein OppF [Paludifilum halophilum]